MRNRVRLGPLVAAGLLLGAGLGGLLDGIVIHQLLQWDYAAIASAANVGAKSHHPIWDGVLHAFNWLMAALGLAQLFSAGTRPEVPWSRRILLGALLMGWGLLRIAEGSLDQGLLSVHPERSGTTQLAWDLGFRGFGLLLAVGGWQLIRIGRQRRRGPMKTFTEIGYVRG
jgi:uncharacterized membrane protein